MPRALARHADLSASSSSWRSQCLCFFSGLLGCLGLQVLVLLYSSPDALKRVALGPSRAGGGAVGAWGAGAGARPARPPPAAFAGVTPCHCFEACDWPSLKHWLVSMPEILESEESPWYAYLEAVYGSPPTLPFNLSKLRFFYHNSFAWARKHGRSSTVFLPIRPCSRHKQAGRRMPNCSADFCKLWQASATTRRKLKLPGAFGCHHFFEQATGGESVGTLCENDNFIEPPMKPHTWFEVMRSAFPYEGQAAYGYWFKRAPGSAIWLNSGKTVTWQLKHEGEYRNMTRLWLILRNKSVDMKLDDIYKYARSLDTKSENFMPGFPLMGWELGYDTIFIEQAREVVLTSHKAMVKPTCAQQYPGVAGKIHFCSPGQGACAGFEELKTGWHADITCNCNNSKFILNCNSITA